MGARGERGEWEEGGRAPWEQMAEEPDLWYGRFQVYLELGVLRSLKAAARAAGEKTRGKPGTRNGKWSYAFYRWHWRARAHAWDAHQRELLALSERNRRLALRERRLERMETYLDDVAEVLDNAHMTEADEKQAREWLPQMRVFLRDLLVAERQEFARGEEALGDPEGGPAITADDLRAAERLLEAQGPGRWPRDDDDDDDDDGDGDDGPLARGALPPTCGEAVRRRYPAGRTLLVCVGPDCGLRLDLAALRAVRAATGLQFMRVLEATQQKFAATLRRERQFGRPVELLHLALHASADGVEFADGTACGDWLSERLLGVRVMVLAACEGESVGDWLGVVPYVVTLSEEISHEDAAVLTQQFWHNVGLGMEPPEALEEALGRCPPVVGEYVVRHW